MWQHWEQRPDGEGELRQAIIFHLELLTEVQPTCEPQAAHVLAVQAPVPTPYSARTQALLELGELARLRLQALAAAQPMADVQTRLVNLRQRSQAIKAYALARAQGHCEACRQPAPFEAKTGPYLEVHHVYRLADGGPDHPNKVMALCPNCHREAHYAKAADDFNERLKKSLSELEPADASPAA